MVFRHWTIGSIGLWSLRGGKEMMWALRFPSLLFRTSFKSYCREGEPKEPNTPTELMRIRLKFEDTDMVRIYKAKYWKGACFIQKKLWRLSEESSWVWLSTDLHINERKLPKAGKRVARQFLEITRCWIPPTKMERSHNSLVRILRRVMPQW